MEIIFAGMFFSYLFFVMLFKLIKYYYKDQVRNEQDRQKREEEHYRW